MSSLVVYAVITGFWLTMGLFFLGLDLAYGWPRLKIWGRDVSPAWLCFIFAVWSAVRVFVQWNYEQNRMRRRITEELHRQQNAARKRERTEPPDPNFQFTDKPPTDPPANHHRPLPDE